MILTEREIRIHLDRRLVAIEPRPADNVFSSTSVDLTLHPEISVYKDAVKGVDSVIDPTLADFRGEAVINPLIEKHVIDQDGYRLAPGKLILAWTREYVDLKFHARLAGRVEGKSSLARLGLAIHITAPTIHAGFDGRIRLEMINHGALPIKLTTGMPICQLVFEQTLGTPDEGYKGRFSGQH